MHIGIDPGVSGAISFINDGELIGIQDMPVLFDKKGKRYIDAPKLYELLLNYKIDYANMELVHASPQMGVTSAFNFGRSYGVVLGVLAASEIKINSLTPQAWKKKFNLIGTEKDAARELVVSMMSDKKELFLRKKDIDRADAVLIGLM